MTSRKIATIATVGVLALGTTVFAACGGGNASSPETVSNAANPVDVEVQNNRPEPAAPTGSADDAKKAALDRTGGGEVMSVEADEDGWDVDIIKGGSEYTIELDGALNVVGEESEQLQIVEGPEGEQATKAALDAAGGGELISLESDDDGYDAEIIKREEEISIELDSSFNVIGEERETLQR
jgi:hypothetical protein